MAGTGSSDRRIGTLTFKNVRMHTVLLAMCPTDGPMARGARGDIPGNSLGQGFTSTSTLTHGWGAYGAPMLCRRRAADGRRSSSGNSLWADGLRFSLEDGASGSKGRAAGLGIGARLDFLRGYWRRSNAYHLIEVSLPQTYHYSRPQ